LDPEIRQNGTKKLLPYRTENTLRLSDKHQTVDGFY
jgi:hypothetical protein